MIATLSPAKTLDYESPLPLPAVGMPRFAAEAEMLAAVAARLGPKKLGALMHISDKLAKLNSDRFRAFADAPARPAIFAFAGDVYTGLEAKTLDEAAIAFAQDHVRLLSGLYGLLRPLDPIKPYRLEMGTRWAPRRKKLTDWWQDRIARVLAEDVEAEGSGTILNLASQEYWASVDGQLSPDIRVIAVEFHEADGRFISFHAKKARGMMARWLVEHRIDQVEAMKGFDSAGYAFDAAGSDADRWRFVRQL